VNCHGNHGIPNGHSHDGNDHHHHKEKQDRFSTNLLAWFINSNNSLHYNVYISLIFVFLPSFLILWCFIGISTYQAKANHQQKPTAPCTKELNNINEIPKMISKPQEKIINQSKKENKQTKSLETNTSEINHNFKVKKIGIPQWILRPLLTMAAGSL